MEEPSPIPGAGPTTLAGEAPSGGSAGRWPPVPGPQAGAGGHACSGVRLLSATTVHSSCGHGRACTRVGSGRRLGFPGRVPWPCAVGRQLEQRLQGTRRLEFHVAHHWSSPQTLDPGPRCCPQIQGLSHNPDCPLPLPRGTHRHVAVATKEGLAHHPRKPHGQGRALWRRKQEWDQDPVGSMKRARLLWCWLWMLVSMATERAQQEKGLVVLVVLSPLAQRHAQYSRTWGPGGLARHMDSAIRKQIFFIFRREKKYLNFIHT